MRISWLAASDRITHELQQREEEGNDVAGLRRDWKQIEDLPLSDEQRRAKAELFYRALDETPSRIQNERHEPTAWNEIVLQCKIKPETPPPRPSSLIGDRILGGWLGRSAGCLLGKPVESIPRPGIIELLSSNGTWPISDYITERGIPDPLLKQYPWNRHSGKQSLKENIVCMNDDDDMNYPMANLSAYERCGEEFTTEDILQTWLTMLPVLSTFTAERVAYVNALNGLRPPETALVGNPYREWIGAQIRADLWGWISPAHPGRAAEFAWRDARLSHVRNGVYGEVFVAAAIAAAFKHENAAAVVREALSFVPPHSRFADAIGFVLSLPIRTQPWENTVESLYATFGKYHWVHTLNNAALVVAALLSANGDYERAICNVVMGGWDTDSNGATVGSIMGTMLGAKNLPSKWIAPLNDRIQSSLKGFDHARLSDLAKRTARIAASPSS